MNLVVRRQDCPFYGHQHKIPPTFSSISGFCFMLKSIWKHVTKIQKCLTCCDVHTWSPALGPSVLKRMGLHLLSSFIKLEFWKCAMRAAFPCMRAYASNATFSLLNFSHFFPLNACHNLTFLLALVFTLKFRVSEVIGTISVTRADKAIYLIY